jgi:hypothetical protein
MAVTKFYQYTIWIEGDDGAKIDPMSIANSDIFSNDLYCVSDNDEKKYHSEFRKIGSSSYQGRIIRTKDESSYLRRNEDDTIVPLSDKVSGDGDTGSINRSHTDFALKVGHQQFDLLVEVGFQTPGIGIIQNYIKSHMELPEDYKIRHETKLRDLDDGRIRQLLNSDLKTIDVSFKKSPETYEGDDTRRSLNSMMPDNYRLKFSVSLQQGDQQERQKVRDYLRNNLPMFGSDGETVEQSISKIDFPRIMHTFRIVGINGNEEIEENLSDLVLKEEIDTDPYTPFSNDLGKRLCETLDS